MNTLIFLTQNIQTAQQTCIQPIFNDSNFEGKCEQPWNF